MIHQLTNIPIEMRSLPQWVGSKNKIPMNPHTYLAASSTDAATWASYAEAVQAVELNKWDTVGFVLQAPFVGIDLDDSVAADGTISDFARSIIEQCASYTEISPSGTGIHILCKGTIPAAIKTAELEVYQTGRYFTMTGNVVKPYSVLRTVDLGFLFEGRKAVRPIAERLEDIQPGNRNNSFTSLAGSLRSKGYNAEDIYAFLKPRAVEVNFDLNELSTICRSVCRYEPKVAADNQSEQLEQFLLDYKPAKWLIPGLLADNTINILAGLSECRKSWLLADLAVALASGGEWLNRTCEKRRVMLIDQERPRSELQRRLRALIKGRAINVKHLNDNLLPVVGTSIRLDLQQSYDAFCRRIEADRPDVILIDSFKTFTTKDINSQSDMQMVMERVKELRARYNITFVFLYHESKAAHQRDREGREVTTEYIAGASVLSEVPEGIMIATKSGPDASVLLQVKNSYGLKVDPTTVKVVDLDEAKSAIRVEANL